MFQKKVWPHIAFVLRHRTLFFMIAFFSFLILYSLKLKRVIEDTYDDAQNMMSCGNYSEAASRFEQLGAYKDSVESLCIAQNHIDYEAAQKLFNLSDYKNAAQAFEQLGDFEGSDDMALESWYQYAIELFQSKDYADAAEIFGKLRIQNYRDSALYAAKIDLALYETSQKTVYNEAKRLYAIGEYEAAIEDFQSLDGYLDSEELAQKCKAHIQRMALATTVSAGIRYSAAVTEDGEVKTTGYNAEGQSDVSEWKNIVSVSAKGRYTVGLKADGTTIISSKAKDYDESEWVDIVAVSAGESYFVGLKSDGSVVSAGHDAGDGQRRVGGWENMVAIATGWRHTVGLDKDGQVHITGYGANSQMRQIQDDAENWVNIVAVAAGGGSNDYPGKGHTVGLRSDGRVFAVGDNEYGQCEVDEWRNVVAIAAGDWHTVGLCEDGTVVSTTPPEKFASLYKGACEVGTWKDKNIVAIAAGSGTTLGLRQDGTVIAIGFNEFNQSSFANEWTNIKRVFK